MENYVIICCKSMNLNKSLSILKVDNLDKREIILRHCSLLFYTSCFIKNNSLPFLIDIINIK